MRQNLNLSIPEVQRIPIYQTMNNTINKTEMQESTRKGLEVNEIIGRKKKSHSFMNSMTNTITRNTTTMTSPERNALVTQY